LFFGDRPKSEAEYMAEGYPRKVAAYMAANPPPPFEVFPTNRQAFELFEFLATQWRGGMGGRESLIYSEAYSRMDELGIDDKPRRLSLINDMRVMEQEVLAAIAERRQQS
jgi:hypothetical protein